VSVPHLPRTGEPGGLEPDAYRDLVAGLVEDADQLAELVGQPTVRIAGASGVLNPHTVGVVRVWGAAVDTAALVGALAALPLPPDLLVLAGIEVDEAPLRLAGWSLLEDVIDVRHERPAALDAVLPTGYALRTLDRPDLPAARRLLDESFAADDSGDHLPDQVLDVRGLRLWGAVGIAGTLVGVVGTRPSPGGALLFSLATSPRHRRRGLAACLVAEAGRWTARQGGIHLRADVGIDLLPFYGQLGFRPHVSWRRYARVRPAEAAADRPGATPG
jgi:GNAT superfamily N-acetyltransferase